MERLTFSTEKYGAGLFCLPNYTCKEICELQDKCENCPIQTAFNKLASYEETGLMPYDVEELMGDYKGLEAVNDELREEIKKLELKYENLEYELDVHDWEEPTEDDF